MKKGNPWLDQQKKEYWYQARTSKYGDSVDFYRSTGKKYNEPKIAERKRTQLKLKEGILKQIRELEKEKSRLTKDLNFKIYALYSDKQKLSKYWDRFDKSADAGFLLEPKMSRQGIEYFELLDEYKKKTGRKVLRRKPPKRKNSTMNGLGFELFSSESDDYLEMTDMEAGLDALEKFHDVSTSIFGNLFSDKKEEMSFNQMVNIIKNSRGGSAQIEGLGMGIKFNRMSEGDVKSSMERAWKANKRYPKTAGDISVLRSALQETSTQLSFPDIVNVAKSTVVNIGEDLAQAREVAKSTATEYTKWSKYAFPIGVAFVGAITIMILRSQVTGTFKGLKSLAKTTRKRMKRR